jgi:hypothetical protein
MKFLRIYECTLRYHVLIPVDRIKSVGFAKHGGSYILTDTDEYYTDRSLDDLALDLEKLSP